MINEKIKNNESIQTKMALHNQIINFQREMGMGKIFISSFRFL